MKSAREIKNLVSQMTIEEKASLCSGLDFWTTKPVERLNIPSIMVTDGPHGLRKQNAEADHLGINKSVVATCFPAACATACSFDRELLTKIGESLAEECIQENVSVILGPGANIKRSPLCGRNFEYFSEDPLLSGEMAAALIRGIESKGIGTSLKHFAANNQEKSRMFINAVVDPRALYEIYLKSFEIAVRKGRPSTVMCAYNRLNDAYCCENEMLLTDSLRTTWGFDGIVMTDWGAMNNRVKALSAGLELEMPGCNGITDQLIVEAVKSGDLEESILDRAAERMLHLIFKTSDKMNTNYRYDSIAHHTLAKEAVIRSAVLLKNEGTLLPIKKEASIAVIGEFAKIPRYQGAGSSKINPHKVDSLVDGLTQSGISYDFASGYRLDNHNSDADLIEKACEIAKDKDSIIIVAGLPDEFESEGFDRTTLSMPDSHNKLITEVAKINKNIVVVLLAGSAVQLPWLDEVKAVLNCFLTGQAGGSAIVELLTGKANPSGKLAETFPLSIKDTPCYNYFPGASKSVEYRESIFVGYRYYDTVGKPVLFPFGYGLSYTTFEYSNLSVIVDTGDQLTVSLDLTNTGSVSGSEVVQLYVSKLNSAVFRSKKELKDFAKVELAVGEIKTITIKLNKEAFSFFCAEAYDFLVEGGEYEILLGSSSADIRLSAKVVLTGDTLPIINDSDYRTEYTKLSCDTLSISDKAFTALYGKKLPPTSRLKGEAYTVNTTLDDITHTKIGQDMLVQMQQHIATMFDEANKDIRIMFEAMLLDMPLRSFGIFGQFAADPKELAGIIAKLNADIKE